MTVNDYATPRGGRMTLARTRGMASGVLLIILGAWAALVPFIGDYFDFAYKPTSTWTWTAGRGWYEVLPGAVAFLGGLMLLFSANRMVALAGAWFGAVAGAWLVLGPQLAPSLSLGKTGRPSTSSTNLATLERLLYFYAVGAAMLFVASVALGRLSVRSMRDIRVAREAAILDAAAKEPATTGAPARTANGTAATAPAAATPATTNATPAATDTNRQHHRHFQFLHRNRDEAPAAPPTQSYGPDGYPGQQTTSFPTPEQQRQAPPPR